MSLAARTARNTVLVAGSRLASRLVVFYVFLLIARSMASTPGDYGRFSLLVVFSSLVSVVVDIGLRPLFIREAARDRQVLTPYLNSILSLKLVMSLPAFVILYVLIRVMIPESVGETVIPTLALLLGASFSNQMRATFYAVGDLRYEAVATIGETAVLLAGTVAVAVLHWPWWFFLWAYALSYGFTTAFAAVVAVARFGHRFAFDLNLVRLSMLARESLPFALSFIISTLYYKIDQPMLDALRGPATGLVAVAMYAAAYKLLDGATFVPQALMDPVYPALSRLSAEAGDRLQGAVIKSYKLLAVAGVPVAAGMFVLAPEIVRYGLGPNYADAVPILRVLAVSVFFLFVNNTFIYTLNAMGRQSDSTRLAVLSLVLNVGLNVVLIPQDNRLYGGAMGAAWATAATELGLLVGGWVLLRRHLFAMPLLGPLKGVIPAGLLCLVAMAGLAAVLPVHPAAFVVAALAGALAYGGGLLALHAFTEEEIALARGVLRRR